MTKPGCPTDIISFRVLLSRSVKKCRQNILLQKSVMWYVSEGPTMIYVSQCIFKNLYFRPPRQIKCVLPLPDKARNEESFCKKRVFKFVFTKCP